jgi:hypothetical protein
MDSQSLFRFLRTKRAAVFHQRLAATVQRQAVQDAIKNRPEKGLPTGRLID